MLKSFVNRILELSEPHIVESGEGRYVDKAMEFLPSVLVCSKAMESHSLTSIVDYINQHADRMVQEEWRRLIVHVRDYNDVMLVNELCSDMERDCYVHSTAFRSEFRFGAYMDLERFLIDLSAHFAPSAELETVMNIAANIINENSVQQEDDGISQKVTVRNGISLAKNVTIKNPVTLSPYRTFPEIEQPAGKFIFRLKKERDGVTAALFQSASESRKNDAILNIKRYIWDQVDENNRDNLIVLG